MIHMSVVTIIMSVYKVYTTLSYNGGCTGQFQPQAGKHV